MHNFLAVYLFILASVFPLFLDAKLAFTVEPSDIVYAPGQSVTLNCQALDSNGRPVVINWKRNDDWLNDPNGKPWQYLRNHSLYYASISEQDGGQFKCGASISGTNEAIYSREASVRAAYTSVQFNTNPTNHSKRVGDASTYFTCVTGNSLPYANVYWEKDGVKLLASNVVNQQLNSGTPGVKWTSSSLSISNIEFSSGGFYRCVAVNSFVTSIVRKSEAGYLKVLPKEDKPHFQVHPTNMVASEHKPAMLQCLILGIPQPTISWTYNGQSLVSSPTRQVLSNGSLYFPSANRSYTGQYKCRGSNSVGLVESSDVLFSVAFFDFQFFEQPASQNVTLGSKVTLHCKPPTSYPADITINWFKNYQPIQSSPGISISSTGSVVFSAIKKSDEGSYFCNGINKVLQQSRSSYIAVVTVWVPPTFTRLPLNTAVIINHQLSLHCEVTGFPTPVITWHKDGVAINSSHAKLLDNGNLVIQNAAVKDAGNYSCFANNVAGQAVKSAIVDIYVPPTISIMPSDAVAVLGQPVTFKCGFHGNPSPSIQWYHGNGSTFSPVSTTPKYNVTEGSLRITAVSISDKGTFLCKGTNVAGAVNKTAHLNVQVPVSLDSGPVNITVNQSLPASFKCVASGDPKPNITWYNGGVLLQHGGRYIITGETLSISKTVAADAGEYQCHVTNGLAMHVGKAHLVVQVIPNIISLNVPFFVKLGDSTIMTCQSNGIPRPQVTWYRESVIITGSRFTIFSNGSLRIVGITRNDGGVYMCHAGNAAGHVTRSGNLTIQVPPYAPVQLTATSMSSTSIKLSWQPGFNGYSPITSYKVEIMKGGQVSFTVIEPSLNGRELVVRQLQSYSNYTFKVSARNAVGLGDSSQASNTTLQDAPSHPHRMTLTSVNSTAIQIQWSAPSQPNGVITRYEVVYQALPSGSALKKEVPSAGNLLVVITSLRPFTKYAVKIRAATVQWGNYSDSFIQRTNEAAPVKSPRDVDCHAVGSTAVFVSWKPVPIGSTNGIVRLYRILYRAIRPTLMDVAMETVNNRTLNYTVEGLKPWTVYNISVQASTVDFGPASEWKTVRTNEAAPTGPPVVKLTSLNESTILVTMSPPPVGMRNGIIIGYNVSYKSTNALSQRHVFVSTNHGNDTAEVLLSSLEVYTFYDVTVAAVTTGGVGVNSKVKQIRTEEGVPSPVTSFNLQLIEENKVSVTWSPPSPIRGVILHYKVTHNSSDGDVTEFTTKETSMILRDLQYNTTFHIWIVAKTSKGYGKMGNILKITTGIKPTLAPTTVSPTTPVPNTTEPVVIATAGKNTGGVFLSETNLMIILIVAGVVFLILVVLIIYCGCVRPRREQRSEHLNARKTGAFGFDAHELRGVSPDRRPVLDVHEETSVVDSFEDFSELNSSITGLVSDQTGSELLPQKTYSPPPPSSETGTQPVAQPIVSRSESKEKQAKVKLPHGPLEKTRLNKLKSKKLSIGSNASYYDQPYSSVDELGTGFSSFTPPPPEDFRNDSSSATSVWDDTPRDPPTVFSNQLFSLPSVSQPQFPSEYAEPYAGSRPQSTKESQSEPEVPEIEKEPVPVEEEVIEAEELTPPPEAFMSDFEGVLNEGYDTDEELDNYLAKPGNSSPTNQSGHPTSSPTPPLSSRGQSPPNRDDAMPVYAVVDKSKKKKKKKDDKDHDAVVVYDERTNL